MDNYKQKLNQELLRSIINFTIPAKKVEQLLKKGADPNLVVDKKMSKNIISKLSFSRQLSPEIWYDYTPLEIAASLGRVRKFKLLREYGADIHHVNTKNKISLNNVTILDRAIDTSTTLEMLKQLSLKDIPERDTMFNILWGIVFYSPAIIPGLALYTWDLIFDDAKPNVNSLAYKDIVESLVKDGAKVTVEQLVYPVNYNNVTLLPFLCKNVEDINAFKNGLAGKETLLHSIADTCNFDAVRILVEHGADLNIKNPKGYTPIDLAEKSGNIKMKKFMTELKKEKESKLTKNPNNIILDGRKELIVSRKELKRKMFFQNVSKKSRMSILPIIGKNKNFSLSRSI